MHRLDLPDLERLVAYAPLFGVEAEASPAPSLFLAGGERLTWSGPDLELLEAPGHSPGSLCFYIPDQEILVSGDVLFERSIGRTDLPGGHHATLLDSIQRVLWALPENTIVYPGHGESTQIGIEKRENPFLRVD
jgi:glyoxylase-like metal-dependent hydrolase (beta-lactamase superfamily II)